MEIGQFALALVGHFLASLLYVLQKLHLVEAVDSTSILEHRDELRELWEKRMMADDHQSSSPSIMAESNSKTSAEGETEEKVMKSESEPNTQHKMSNGHVSPTSNSTHDDNANHLPECNGNVVQHSTDLDADQENNNSADSLEEDNVDYVEQKTYTSNYEQTLVTSEVKEVKSITSISTTVEEVHEVKEVIETSTEEIVVAKSSENSETKKIETEKLKELEITVATTENHDTSAQSKKEEKIEIHEDAKDASIVDDNEPTAIEKAIIQDYQEKFESLSEKLILPVTPIEDEDDGFIPLEECLPKEDNADEEVDLPGEHFEQSTDEPSPSLNAFGDHMLTSPAERQVTEKVQSPEIEQFVKSGGVKRIIPGVQKTEQPYNTCTTETKIAMEIREMREREEELRIMRERASMSPASSPVPPKTPSTPSIPSPSPSPKEGPSPIPQGPGYRVSSVFGHKGAISPSSADDDKKLFRNFANKESAVEKEIRLAKDREEELRKQKGLPPREDDSYVKPSQVKSSQVRVFGKTVGSNSIKQAATAKIQLEIEEQTQREMALRETGSIQTISQERTDAKVAKLKTAENNSTPHVYTNGNSHPPVNGTYTNGHSSTDFGAPYKRSSPSPTNARPASIFAHNNGISKGNISMHKFINSKGKETAFTSPRNGPFSPREETLSKPVVPPTMVNLKRTVSVESKIQQEIMEMKQREEELKKLHLKMINGGSDGEQNSENVNDHEMNHRNMLESENGNGIGEEELSPRHNKLIAQWEQRIQKAES